MSIHQETHDHGHFIIPIKYYVMTLVVLLILTVVTVYTAKFIDLSWGNIVLAMFIAIVKAGFVTMFFMGLRWDRGLNIAAFLSAVVVLAIFVSFIVLDTGTRGSIDIEEEGKQNLETPVKIVK